MLGFSLDKFTAAEILLRYAKDADCLEQRLRPGGRLAMIVAFFAALALIHPLLPGLIRMLILIVVATGVWIVLSIPAFWLCRAVGSLITSGIALLASVRKALFGKALALLRTAAEPLDAFLTTHSRLFDFYAENARVVRELESIRRSIDNVPEDLLELETSIISAAQRFEQSAATANGVEIPSSISPPTPEQFALVKAANNRAWATLILALLLTPPAVLFNWGMLSKFFEGMLGQIEFGDSGILVADGLAAGGTLLEIIFGAWLARTSSRTLQLILVLCLVCLAILEGVFYGLLGAGMSNNPFDVLYAPSLAPLWTKMWFGLFGPILVVALSFCGHYFVKSLLQLSDKNVVSQWRRFIRGRIRSATVLRNELEKAGTARQKLINALADLKNAFTESIGEKDSRSKVICGLKRELTVQVEHAAAIRMPDVMPLSRGAMIVKVCEWLFMAVAVPIALWALQFAFVWAGVSARFVGLGSGSLAWTLGTIQALALLISGNVTNRTSATLTPEEGKTTPPPHRQFVMWFVSLGVLFAVICCDAFWTLGAHNHAHVATFFVMLVAALLLFWCGTQLGHIWATLWCVLRCLISVLIAAVPALEGVVVAVAQLVMLIFRALLIAAAYPYSVLYLKDASGSALMRAQA